MAAGSLSSSHGGIMRTSVSFGCGVRQSAIVFLATLAFVGCSSPPGQPSRPGKILATSVAEAEPPAGFSPPMSPVEPRRSDGALHTAPATPTAVAASTIPQVVLVSASWCQWCMVFESEVLHEPEVATTLSSKFELLHVDLDLFPEWGDIAGFRGLPSLVFFDRQGRHVLTRSGYRPPDEVIALLTAVFNKLASGELEPYPAPPPGRALAERSLSAAEIKQELARLEFEVFLRVNSNDGGFETPARHPYPALLVELERWRQHGAPPRVAAWIDKTTESALRGSSPRHEGVPLADMDFATEELITLSQKGPGAGPRWREGIDRLPQADPFRGLQDPVDGGVFRYAAGPGWYNPHFERRAIENLAWAELAQIQGRAQDARILRLFVDTTFAYGQFLATSQQSDPFYYRLRRAERRRVPTPRAARLFRLEVQARAAQVDPRRCEQLLRVPGETWPRARWTEDEDEDEEHIEEATPDSVGELLVGLAGCEGKVYRERTQRLVDTVLERWRRPLPSTPRLFGLTRGICRAAPAACGRALATVSTLPFDPAYPPPFVEYASREEQSEMTPGTSPSHRPGTHP